MSRASRRRLYLTLGLMPVAIVAELVTIGAVLPLLALASDPDSRIIEPWAREWLAMAGGTPLVGAAVVLAAAAVAAAAVRLSLAWATQTFVTRLGNELAVAIFARMLRQPYAAYLKRNSSEVLSAMDKVQRVISGVLQPVLQGVIAAVMALFVGALLFAINAQATVAGALAVLLAYAALHFMTRARVSANSRALADRLTQRTKIVQEGLGGIRDIILEQSHDLFEARFGSVDRQFRRAAAENYLIAGSPRYVIEAAVIVAISAMILALSGRPGELVAAIPMLGALGLGAQRLLPLVQQAWSGWSTTRGHIHSLADVAALAAARAAAPRPRAAPLRFAKAVKFERVSYRYDGARFALADVSLRIGKGERVGLAGTTGSGKSTLLDLLMGLLEPDEGAILIDGTPPDDATRPAWQAAIAHVPQSIFLADDTIAANIVFAAAGPVDRARLEQAAEAARLGEFIAGLPEGYDTLVGERGIRLSGGQRQRIGIARALYKDAALLVLDEATSALDETTEAEIMRSIAALPDGLTIVIASHRRSTLEQCDRIVRVEGGALADAK